VVGEEFDGEQQGDWWPAGDQDRLPSQDGRGGDVRDQGHRDPQAEGGPQDSAGTSAGVWSGAQQADAGQQQEPVGGSLGASTLSV
jgi:hypothetical protein